MSLLRAIVNEIHRTGEGSLNTLAPKFPTYSRQQIRAAIQNAASRREIYPLRREPGRGRGKGAPPAIYGLHKVVVRVEPEPRHALDGWLTGAATCAAER